MTDAQKISWFVENMTDQTVRYTSGFGHSVVDTFEIQYYAGRIGGWQGWRYKLRNSPEQSWCTLNSFAMARINILKNKKGFTWGNHTCYEIINEN